MKFTRYGNQALVGCIPIPAVAVKETSAAKNKGYKRRRRNKETAAAAQNEGNKKRRRNKETPAAKNKGKKRGEEEIKK